MYFLAYSISQGVLLDFENNFNSGGRKSQETPVCCLKFVYKVHTSSVLRMLLPSIFLFWLRQLGQLS
jgi:hypothetical protein